MRTVLVRDGKELEVVQEDKHFSTHYQVRPAGGAGIFALAPRRPLIINLPPLWLFSPHADNPSPEEDGERFARKYQPQSLQRPLPADTKASDYLAAAAETE